MVIAESGLVGFVAWAAVVVIWIAIAFWSARRKGHNFLGTSGSACSSSPWLRSWPVW